MVDYYGDILGATVWPFDDGGNARAAGKNSSEGESVQLFFAMGRHRKVL
jgi:hypothetical protein